MFIDEVDPNRDNPGMREYEFQDYVIQIGRVQPYSFWSAKVKGMTLPERLQGLYTDLEYARLATEAYLQTLPPKKKK